MQTPDTSTDQTDTTNCCARLDKHLAAFAVRVLFGFVLALFCMGALVYEMVHGGARTEFVSMYFSLLSFAAGYFLGATPGLKRPTAVTTYAHVAAPQQYIDSPPEP
ncbi:hypothetical protein [Yaravirus sp. 'brasiliensis']|uniref:Uncharacterized protein n=1 Tax=Yaravirus sp. 'brasiliensis' TaxID=2739681 RepID=A0AAE7E2U0_9VIRU|nr:hypothetical protein QKS73_gp73 [Yaravirus brasiliensis]QKE44404.1 hypothetical protein [Yaravirus brasiliensis]